MRPNSVVVPQQPRSTQSQWGSAPRRSNVGVRPGVLGVVRPTAEVHVYPCQETPHARCYPIYCSNPTTLSPLDHCGRCRVSRVVDTVTLGLRVWVLEQCECSHYWGQALLCYDDGALKQHNKITAHDA
jgi:hypothetical protein